MSKQKEKSKVEHYKRQLDKHEAKQKRVAKLFNVDEVLAGSEDLREIYVPEIDMTVKYGVLTIGDLTDIVKAETDEEKAIRMLWKMLHKADKTVTLEKVKALPLQTATAILTRIAAPLPRTLQALKRGSAATRKPKFTV